MTIYYSNTEQAFYHTDIFDKNKIPEDALQITASQYKEIFEGLNSGNKVMLSGTLLETSARESNPTIERAWRDTELCRADSELNKVQDSDPNAVGSVSEWRNYRKQLRAWPKDINFPDKAFRPKSPRI